LNWKIERWVLIKIYNFRTCTINLVVDFRTWAINMIVFQKFIFYNQFFLLNLIINKKTKKERMRFFFQTQKYSVIIDMFFKRKNNYKFKISHILDNIFIKIIIYVLYKWTLFLKNKKYLFLDITFNMCNLA